MPILQYLDYFYTSRHWNHPEPRCLYNSPTILTPSFYSDNIPIVSPSRRLIPVWTDRYLDGPARQDVSRETGVTDRRQHWPLASGRIRTDRLSSVIDNGVRGSGSGDVRQVVDTGEGTQQVCQISSLSGSEIRQIRDFCRPDLQILLDFRSGKPQICPITTHFGRQSDMSVCR